MCSHPGQCDADVLSLSQDPKIANQLKKLDPKVVSQCLKEYGAWNDEDLSDHGQNLQRLLWIAACDISESN
jgi:hypothetical protein